MGMLSVPKIAIMGNICSAMMVMQKHGAKIPWIVNQTDRNVGRKVNCSIVKFEPIIITLILGYV